MNVKTVGNDLNIELLSKYIGELTVKRLPSYERIIRKHLLSMSIHRLEKLYECKDYGKQFKYSTTFVIHRGTHSEESS